MIDGVAPEDADTVDVTWKTTDGSERTRTADVVNGKWSRELNDLPLGKTTVKLTAYAGVDVVAESEVEVDLAVAELTAHPEFSDDVEQVARVTGTATPNTTIKAFHGERSVQTTVSGPDGAYALSINAPNMGGAYDLQIVQEIRGEQASSTPVQLDYGTPVSIAGPEDGEQLEPGEQLVIRGAAEPGAKLKVYEEGKSDAPLKELTVGSSGTYRAVIGGDALEDREYKLVVEGITKGNNRTSDSITVNPGKSSVADPTAEVEFRENVDEKAVVTGTGAAGGTITVLDDEGKPLGSATVEDGTWSTPIDPIGPGEHTLTIEQTGIEGTQTTTAVADFGDAVAITSQADGKVAPGVVRVEGTTQVGAEVEVAAAGQTVDAKVDGTTWTADLEISPSTSPIAITATQHSKGALTTTDTKQVTTDGQQEATPVAITDPADHTFVPQQDTTVRGTATPFAKVEVRFQWNDNVQATVTANAKGEWSFVRKYGVATYQLTATQTRLDSTTSTSNTFELAPQGAAVVKPTADVVFGTSLSEKAVVTGSGQADSVITVKDRDDNVLGRQRVPGTSGAGTWSIPIDPIGPGQHTLTVEQESGVGTDTTTAVADFGDAVAITSQADGKVAPGVVRVEGTTQVGAEVEVAAAGQTVDAKVDGATWTADLEISPSTSPIAITATQHSKGALTTTDTKQVTTDGQQEATPVAITDPADHTFVPQQDTTVRGTATPFAKVQVRFQWNDNVQATVTANAKGEWSFVRKYAGDAVYQLTATQTRLDGTTSTSNTFAMGAEGKLLPLTLETPALVSTYVPGVPVRFSGTATKYATITATAPLWNNNVVFTVKADANGNWKIDRSFAEGLEYRLTLTQVTENDETDQITGIVLTDVNL